MPKDHEQCGDDIYTRLTRLEVTSTNISEDMHDVKDSLKSISTSLQTLAVLEEKHTATAKSLGRAFDELEKLKKKQEEIEKKLPIMVLASSWVFKFMLGLIGLLGTVALAHMIPVLLK